MKILLADDDRTISLIASLGLKQAGHEVLCASDGMEAVSKALSGLPDLILLDRMMPDMDGLEICLKLKENPRTRDIPVIFLSAKSEPEELRKGLDAGAVGCVRKPFNPANLWHLIAEILAKSGKRL